MGLLLQVSVICVAIFISCHGQRNDLITRRLGVLEYRLVQDIDHLRKELYAELDALEQEQGSDSVEIIEDQNKAALPELAEHVEDDVLAKLHALQKGFQEEKRVVRSAQDKLQCSLEEQEGGQQRLETFLENVSQEITEALNALSKTYEEKNGNADQTKFSDCADWLRNGHVESGVYTVYPDTLWRPLQVYCDMTTSGGGWTVFQRRQDGSEDFNRLWMDYRFGFGNLSGEFWLGNEFIHRLTSRGACELRIELEDFDNDRREAEYGLFSVAPVTDLFRISLEYFSGNVTDSFIPTHNGHQFSTRDKGPSIGCATSYKGGFWYNKCHGVNINGLYLKGEHESYADGVNWSKFRGHHYSLKMTEMKFRLK